MYKLKESIFFFLLMSFTSIYSQSVYTRITETGKVVFSSGRDSSSVSIKEKIAILNNKYIYKYYSKKKLPLIYLSLTNDSTSLDTKYQLSYDNLYGNSLERNYTVPKKKYYKPGIRIRIANTVIDEASLLKLLDYGINHLTELKSLRNKAIKEGVGSNVFLMLPPDKIKEILSAPTTEKIKNIISK